MAIISSFFGQRVRESCQDSSLWCRLSATTVDFLIPLVILLTLAFFISHSWQQRNDSANLPPGPKPLPILGNILDLPPSGTLEYEHWLHHKDAYGPISSITVLGQVIIIIHDRQAAQEILENQAIRSSARPISEFASNLCGYEEFTVSLQYDEKLRRHRRYIHQQLGTKALASKFNDIQVLGAGRFLLRVLNEPGAVFKHLKSTTNSISLQMLFGYEIEPINADPLVDLMDVMASQLSRAAVPSTWVVNFIPALKYLPRGFPGTAYKETARQFKRVTDAVANIPYSFVLGQMAKETDRPCYVSNLVRNCSKDTQTVSQSDEIDIKYTAANLYTGGGDTTVSVVTCFILAMIRYPGVQRKAQKEIESLLGSSKLPSFEDRDSLPYVNALVQELYRWSPTAPLGFPHSMSEDVTYNGHTFPKGAIVMPSVWWFLNDPEVHINPESFDPERYLAPRCEPDPKDVALGFGRRICPGRFMADATLYILVSQMLSVFTIGNATDSHGNVIHPEKKIKPGLLSAFVDFPYKIEPRSEKHAELVKRMAVKQEAEGDSASLDCDLIREVIRDSANV